MKGLAPSLLALMVNDPNTLSRDERRAPAVGTDKERSSTGNRAYQRERRRVLKGKR